MAACNNQQLIDIITNDHKAIEIVSFDVFDTLIRRRITPPDLSKVPAARRLQQILEDLGVKASVRDILAVRDSEEKHLRKASSQAGRDFEAHIDDICRAWLEALLPSNEAVNRHAEVLEAELSAEKSVCYAAEGMIDVVAMAKRLGKRVIFVSDMYLGLRHVQELLDHCGYGDLFDNGYVSSENKLCKYSGRLFQCMLSDERVPASRWLHIGDNVRSDVVRVRRMGGRAVHFLPQGHKERVRKFARLTRLSSRNKEWSGVQWVEMCQALARKPGGRGFAYEMGLLLFGPALSNFVHWIIERAKAEDIDSVFFPAREGFVLAEIYKTLAPALFHKKHIPCHYVFLNRQTVYPASIDHIGERELRTGLRLRHPTVRAFLKRLGLEPEAFEPLARQYGLASLSESIGKPFSQKINNAKFLDFIEAPGIKSALLDNKRKHEAILNQYLRQCGFWDQGKAAIVDLGWWGTCQEALTRAFGHRKDWPRLYGFYLALLQDPPSTPGSTYECLFFQDGKNSIGHAVAKNFAEVLELAIRAPHATTTQLTEAPDGSVIPVFKDDSHLTRQKELGDRELTCELQMGIFDFAQAYAQLIPFHQDPPECHTRSYLNQLDRLAHMPLLREARVFENFFHIDDFGSDYLLKRRRGDSKIDALRCFAHVFSNYGVNWMQGALAALDLPFLVTGWNLWRIVRRGWD